jgi:hypothetical protein
MGIARNISQRRLSMLYLLVIAILLLLTGYLR